MPKPDQFEALSPHGNQSTIVNAEKYLSVREIVLDVLPTTEPGLTLKELDAHVAERVPDGLFERGTAWWTTTVKLDLEARGLVRRYGKRSPIRHLRVDDAE